MIIQIKNKVINALPFCLFKNQGRIQNSVKHLRRRFFAKKWSISRKTPLSCLARFWICLCSDWSQIATLLKVTLLHECFSHFLNCANGTKSRNTSHI